MEHKEFRNPYLSMTFEPISKKPSLWENDINGIMFIWADKTIRYFPEIRLTRSGLVALPENTKIPPIGYAIISTDRLDLSTKVTDEHGREMPEGSED